MDAEKHPGISALATTVPLEVAGDDNITEKKPALVESSSFSSDDKQDGDVIIRTAQDAATHLLPLRDDFDPALTFRSMFLSTGLAAFQAVMYQIYMVSSTVRAPRTSCRSDDYCSSNRLRSPSKVHSLSSLPFSSAKVGPSSCLVVICRKPVGEAAMVMALFLSGSRPSNLSTPGHGVSRSTLSVPSRPPLLLTLLLVPKSSPRRSCSMTCPWRPLPSSAPLFQSACSAMVFAVCCARLLCTTSMPCTGVPFLR